MSSEGESAKSEPSQNNDKNTSATENNKESLEDAHDIAKDADATNKPVVEATQSASPAMDGAKKESDGDTEKDKKAEEDANTKSHKPTTESEKNVEEKVPAKADEVDSGQGDQSDKSKHKTEDEDEDDNKSDESDKNDVEKSHSNDKDKEVPLLDQPLEKSGKRERKNVQRFDEELNPDQKSDSKVEIENGSGVPLGDIPRVDASISRFKTDDLKLLHRVLFGVVGKTTQIKKNIRKFNGYEFTKKSDEYPKKVSSMEKLDNKQLKVVCEMLDLQKNGNKEEIIERIIDFLLAPKDSGKAAGGGRPKRTAAVRANNRGYSSHDDYSSDERQTSRARRDKGKRPNLKDESSSESDKDFEPPSDGSEERPKVGRRKRTAGRKKAAAAASSDEEDDISEASGATSEDSDDEPRGKRKRGPVKSNNKAKGKNSTTPGRRGRKPAAATAPASKRPTRNARKMREESSEEEEEDSDHKSGADSSSEDEPLVKKTKAAQPPTDEEIKTCVKTILEGANLEEITMKTVCQRVYAHYPDFDLAHKKDFIKTTVKSLIST